MSDDIKSKYLICSFHQTPDRSISDIDNVLSQYTLGRFFNITVCTIKLEPLSFHFNSVQQ